ADLALAVNRAVSLLDDGLGERQTETGPAGLGGEERLKSPRAGRLIHAVTRVLNLYPMDVIADLRAEPEPTAPGHRFARVPDDVEQRLFQAGTIGPDEHLLRAQLRLELDLPYPGLLAKELRNLPNQLVDRGFRRFLDGHARPHQVTFRDLIEPRDFPRDAP